MTKDVRSVKKDKVQIDKETRQTTVEGGCGLHKVERDKGDEKGCGWVDRRGKGRQGNLIRGKTGREGGHNSQGNQIKVRVPPQAGHIKTPATCPHGTTMKSLST